MPETIAESANESTPLAPAAALAQKVHGLTCAGYDVLALLKAIADLAENKEEVHADTVERLANIAYDKLSATMESIFGEVRAAKGASHA